jgi:hypothetical protein
VHIFAEKVFLPSFCDSEVGIKKSFYY